MASFITMLVRSQTVWPLLFLTKKRENISNQNICYEICWRSRWLRCFREKYFFWPIGIFCCCTSSGHQDISTCSHILVSSSCNTPIPVSQGAVEFVSLSVPFLRDVPLFYGGASGPPATPQSGQLVCVCLKWQPISSKNRMSEEKIRKWPTQPGRKPKLWCPAKFGRCVCWWVSNYSCFDECRIGTKIHINSKY